METVEDAITSATALLKKGCKNHILVTLGAQGVLLLSKEHPNKPLHIKAPSVLAIDTTVHLFGLIRAHSLIQSFGHEGGWRLLSWCFSVLYCSLSRTFVGKVY